MKWTHLALTATLLLHASMGWAKPRILAVGDSLTDGYGVAKEAAYPALLEKKLRANGFKDAVVINAGTSGATSAFGVKTMNFHIKRQKPDLIIYALGSNDALRGLKVEQTEKNVEDAIKLAKDQNIKMILVGLKAPPNYGQKFPAAFEAIFPKLAKKYQLPYVDFLLENVAGEPKLNQADGIHPNEKGYEVVAEHIFKAVKKEL